MANYRVVLKTGGSLYLKDIASVAWVSQTVKGKEYRNEFGSMSVTNGPGSGTGSPSSGVTFADPDSVPASVPSTTGKDVLIIDDAMAGIPPRADDVSVTMRRYTPTSGPVYDVPLWNFGGESNEEAA